MPPLSKGSLLDQVEVEHCGLEGTHGHSSTLVEMVVSHSQAPENDALSYKIDIDSWPRIC